MTKNRFKSLLTIALLLFFIESYAQVIYDWTGAKSTSWANAANWSIGGKISKTYPGSLKTDVVRIGTNVNYTNQPVLSSALPAGVASLTFGTNNNQTIILKVNAATLTISGDITQYHSSNNTRHRTAIEGTGTLICNNVKVGNANIPAAGAIEQDSTVVSTLINQFIIQGDVYLQSNASADGNAVYFPAFNIDANTVTLGGQIIMVNTNNISSSFKSNFSYPTRGRFNVNSNATGNYNNTLILNNINPIKQPSATDQGVDFNNEGISTTSVVDYNAATDGQKIYAAADSIGSAGGNYLNLTLSGAGKKIFNGSTVSITGNMITGGGTVDLTANNPVITVSGNWTNKTTTGLGSGSITISGNLVNNSSSKVSGSNTPAVNTIGGTLVNNGTITANAENITVAGAATNNSVITGGSGILKFQSQYVNSAGSVITTSTGAVTFTGNYSNTGGSFFMGAGSVNFYGNYTNGTGSIFIEGTGTAYFSGTRQFLLDNSIKGTVFNNVIFNGGGTATITGGTGNFGVSSTGLLTLANSSKLIAGTQTEGGAAYLTLYSDSAGSANVGPLSGGSSVSGNVNVQRYITGNSLLKYRNYRYFSSPVHYNSSVQNLGPTTGNASNLLYLYTSNPAYPITSGAAGGGFDKTGNPTIYLYREDRNANNSTFSGGNYIGVSNIKGTSLEYNTFNNTTTGGYIPAGNGFVFFYRGSKADLTGRTTLPVAPAFYPDNTTVTQPGFLNQGTVPVVLWYNTTTANSYQSKLSYTPANSASTGFNLVGNPYASTIDWHALSALNTTIDPTIYELDPATNIMATYNATTNTALNNGNRYIASGQGFFVKAKSASSVMSFVETAKVNTQLKSGSTLLLGLRETNPAYAQSLRLSLSKGTNDGFEILAGFNSTSGNQYNEFEDDRYVAPLSKGQQSVFVTSSDGVQVVAKWRALPNEDEQTLINLTVNAAETGTYTFTRTALNAIPDLYDIWLVDYYKKDSLDIKHNTSYVFDIDVKDTATYGANRFKLIIRQDPLLAVHLLSFTGNKVTGGSQISWKTENELNTTNFTVERSNDNGKTFATIGGYLSTGNGTYSLLDKNPERDNNLYRLKMDDVNGVVTYSSIITLYYGVLNNVVAANNVVVYPNPVSSSINLSINNQSYIPQSSTGLLAPQTTTGVSSAGNINAAYVIQITSMNGSVLKRISSTGANWAGDISNFLPGTYIINVTEKDTNKLIGKSAFVKL